jgi:hypothetical protein
VKPAALGELQHGDGGERLHDAAGAEAIAGAHRLGRRHTTEAGDARPAAEPRALHVQDRSRGVDARIAEGVVQRLLELTGELRVEAWARPGRDRRGVSRGARGPAQPGDGKGAGGAHQQRPAVDSMASGAVANRRELIVPRRPGEAGLVGTVWSGWVHGSSLLDHSLGWATAVPSEEVSAMERRIGLSVPDSLPFDGRAPPRTRLPIVTTLLQASGQQQGRRSASGHDSAAPRADRRGRLSI